MENDNVIVKILQRRGRLKRRSDERTFDSISIADMAFLLLIFFIVTGSFVLRQGIFFSLPSKTAGSVSLDERQITEVYPREEGFLHDGTLLNREQFGRLLREREKTVREGVLMIHMGERVRYERLVDTLSVARESGVRRVSLKNADRGGAL